MATFAETKTGYLFRKGMGKGNGIDYASLSKLLPNTRSKQEH